MSDLLGIGVTCVNLSSVLPDNRMVIADEPGGSGWVPDACTLPTERQPLRVDSSGSGR
jgi:hypothetical protein